MFYIFIFTLNHIQEAGKTLTTTFSDLNVMFNGYNMLWSNRQHECSFHKKMFLIFQNPWIIEDRTCCAKYHSTKRILTIEGAILFIVFSQFFTFDSNTFYGHVILFCSLHPIIPSFSSFLQPIKIIRWTLLPPAEFQAPSSEHRGHTGMSGNVRWLWNVAKF